MYARLAGELAVPEWAGRLWMDAWAALGLLALVVLLARLADARAGVAAAVIYVSTRLYHAEAPPLSETAVAAAMATVGASGLGLAALAPMSRAARGLALVVGVTALVLEGWRFGRGSVVVVSAASVTAAWLSLRQRADGRAAGVLAAALTVCAVALALAPLDGHAPALGLCAARGAAAKLPMFDRVIADLGHGFFPWSALLPFALASLVEPPPSASEADGALRVLLLSGSTLSLALGGLAFQCQDPLPFVGSVFVAGALGLWLRDLWRGARVSGAVLVCISLISVILALDFVRIPAKRGVAFGWGSHAEPLGDGVLAHPQAALLFSTSAALTLAGAGVAWLAGVVERLSAWRRHVQGPALFAGALLAALLVQFGYYRGLSARLSPEMAIACARAR